MKKKYKKQWENVSEGLKSVVAPHKLKIWYAYKLIYWREEETDLESSRKKLT